MENVLGRGVGEPGRRVVYGVEKRREEKRREEKRKEGKGKEDKRNNKERN